MAITAKDITKENISELSINSDTRVCEMSGDTQLINVPVNPRIDIDAITSDDPDPKFVNVEVIRAGISKVNRRRYSNNIVREISQLVPGSQGFFGHPDPSKYGFEFREPQCIYVGSIVETMADGIDRCIAKAYLFKTSPLRECIPKSISAGNPMTVSINGHGDVMRSSDIIDVVHMTELQSIDWANPGTEGMENSKAMSVVAELQKKEGGNMENTLLNVKDVLANASITEFKAFNPNGYNAIVEGITIAELQQVNPKLIEAIKESATITEMELNIGGKSEKVKLTEMQGKIDAYETRISEMEHDVEVAKLDAYKSEKIAEAIPENLREMVSKRVTGDNKEAIDASIKNEVEFIREMGGMVNKPIGRNVQILGDKEEDAKAMRGMFGVTEKSK